MKTCPFCAEQIQKAAVVCRHCGRDVPASTAATPTESTTRPSKIHTVVKRPGRQTRRQPLGFATGWRLRLAVSTGLVGVLTMLLPTPALVATWLLLCGGLTAITTGPLGLRLTLAVFGALLIISPTVSRSGPSPAPGAPAQTVPRSDPVIPSIGRSVPAPALPTNALGEWRDHVGAAWDFRMRITEEDDGRIVLVMRARDGSHVRQELVEVRAQATERRRFEHPDSDAAYAIQAANGHLALFDSDGFIRTATKIP